MVFMEVLGNVQNWAKKSFLLFFFFFVYTLLQLMSYTPRFCQMKDLIKIYICGKFHQYSICGCEVKDFWIDSAFMKWPLLVFFRPLLSQTLLNLAEILIRGSLQEDKLSV